MTQLGYMAMQTSKAFLCLLAWEVKGTYSYCVQGVSQKLMVMRIQEKTHKTFQTLCTQVNFS